MAVLVSGDIDGGGGARIVVGSPVTLVVTVSVAIAVSVTVTSILVAFTVPAPVPVRSAGAVVFMFTFTLGSVPETSVAGEVDGLDVLALVWIPAESPVVMLLGQADTQAAKKAAPNPEKIRKRCILGSLRR